MSGPRYSNCLRVLAVLTIVAAIGCQRDEPENRFKPNGEYFERLAASGKRGIVRSDDASVVAKLRTSSRQTKVYDPDTRVRNATIRRTEDGLTVVSPTGETTEVVFASDSLNFPGYVKAERVADGWVVLDGEALKVGYVAHDDGVWSFRRDYTSDSRKVATRSSKGRVSVKRQGKELFYSMSTGLSELEVLTLSIEALDTRGRVVLARWLAHVAEN